MAEKQFMATEKTAKKLIKLIKGKDIAEISITDGNAHITVKQKTGNAKAITATAAKPHIITKDMLPKNPELIGDSKAPALPESRAAEYIRSENVGIFRSNPKASKPLTVGTVFEKGEKLALITAMKLDNEVKAPYKGKIIQVIAAENSIVEYGSPLFEVEPV